MTTKAKYIDPVNSMKRTPPIPLKELLAVALFASKDESRYVLNSVHIEATKDDVILVATDGRSMAVICSRPPQTELFEAEPFQTSIPTTAIDSIRKACGKDSLIEIILDPELVTLQCGPESDRATIQCKPIEGNYPAWRGVVPPIGSETVPSVDLSWPLLDSFTKAAKLLSNDGGIRMGFSQGRNAPVEIKITGVPNFYGVLMPRKQDPHETPMHISRPNWIAA